MMRRAISFFLLVFLISLVHLLLRSGNTAVGDLAGGAAVFPSEATPRAAEPRSITAVAASQTYASSQENQDAWPERERLLNQLPRKNQVQNLSDAEVHHAPAVVHAAGLQLGAFKESWWGQPGRHFEAASLYRDCVLDAEIMDSIRILCLANIFWFERNGIDLGPIPIEPARLIEIARQLPLDD